jgi:hypothetical protein
MKALTPSFFMIAHHSTAHFGFKKFINTKISEFSIEIYTLQSKISSKNFKKITTKGTEGTKKYLLIPLCPLVPLWLKNLKKTTSF